MVVKKPMKDKHSKNDLERKISGMKEKSAMKHELGAAKPRKSVAKKKKGY